jgi:hypothetical protein
MAKREDWLEKLYDEIKKYQESEFKWGKFDCCMFTADCIRAMTDIDYGASFRGKYRSKGGAFKQLLKQTGTDDLDQAISIIMKGIKGIKRIDPAFMQKGDLAIVKLPEVGNSFGVVMNGAVLFPNENGGLYKIKITPTKVWRID